MLTQKDCAVCADDCWWTTCKDSVQQTLDVLTKFTDDYCVDMDRIYASGCSNGGMFVYELANNEKSYAYFAGIATQGEHNICLRVAILWN